MATIGTAYFKDEQAAKAYYYYMDDPSTAYKRKLESGEIHIGKPPIQPGDKILLNQEEGRYFIEVPSK